MVKNNLKYLFSLQILLEMITAETPVKFDRRKHKDDTLLTLYKNIIANVFCRN